jgi:hypothetical protein
MLNNVRRYLQNLPGITTGRKFVVIESDDWGSIKMPNKETFDTLSKLGYKPENDPYLKYDSLASEEDLQALFESLNSVKDRNGNPAKITANAVMANPDFVQIRKDNFDKYSYEPFTETLKRYPKHQKSFEIWKQGMQSKLFHPQYHGREHINVHQWMKHLKNKNPNITLAFDLNMISITSVETDLTVGCMRGLDFFSIEERNEKDHILREGMDLFEKIIGYTSKSFIANCYKWDSTSERTLSELGVNYLQGIFKQGIPTIDPDGNHKFVYKKHYFGDKNQFGQRYLFRNAFFEPSLSPNMDVVSDCLHRIDIAFKCKKPAIIGSHRLNYIGFIDENNRKQNLIKLNILLKEIVKRWSDVEFVSTDELDLIF